LIRLIFIIKILIFVILSSIHDITFLFWFINLYLLITYTMPSKHSLTIYIFLWNVLTIIWKSKKIIILILFINFNRDRLNLGLRKTYWCASSIYNSGDWIFYLWILNIIKILLNFASLPCYWLWNLFLKFCSISHLLSIWAYRSFLIS
jgi:hypothetical protein